MSVRNVVVKQESQQSFICFVCGSPSANFYPLHSKSRSNGSFFPFLEHHQPPSGVGRLGADGIIGACFLCYSFLSQQWDSFERSGTPHVKRLYWLKRADNGPFAGMDVGMQSEYASHFLGIPHAVNHLGPINRREVISPAETSNSQSTSHFKHEYCEPLDCTLIEDSRSKPHQRPESLIVDQAPSVLDLSVQSSRPPSFRDNTPISCLSPSPSLTESCFVCGEENPHGSLLTLFCKPVANCPYFPSLALHPKPLKAKPIDGSGKADVCDRCQKHLIRQWDAYQRANVPNMERQYHLINPRNEILAVNSSQFHCFTCGQEYPRSVCREIRAFPNSEGEPYFRFLEKYLPPPGAQVLTNDGRANVCSLCYKSLYRQFRVYQVENTPEEQRTYKVPAEYVHEPNVLRERLLGAPKLDRPLVVMSACYLCDRSSMNLKAIDTIPHPSKMFFSFIRDLSKLPTTDPIDHQGRVLVCSSCYHLLQTQWESFQNAQVPHNQRHYSLSLHSLPRRHSMDPIVPQRQNSPEVLIPKNHNSTLHIQVTTPDDTLNHHHSNNEPLLTTVTTMSYTSVINTPSKPVTSHLPTASMLNQKEVSEMSRTQRVYNSKDHDDSQDGQNSSIPRICNPLELPSAKPPMMVATNCFICGENSAAGCTYSISAYPPSSGSNAAAEDVPNPFFPFLTKHVPPPNAEMPAEDWTVLVCTFCFHSLMAQWLAYETSPHQEDGNCWTRKYNTHHYVCYICGITTYRKRGRGITVKDFPFLQEHPRPPGALTLLNGESVVTCLTCFESLMSQWKDFERMKLPVEMRKYNWIVIPTPKDDKNSTRHPFQKNRDAAAANNSSRASSSLERSHPQEMTSVNRHDAQTGNMMSLGHGVSKPPAMLNMQQHPSGTPKPVSVRTMAAAVSPMYQVGPPQHGASSHNLGVFGGNNSNPNAAFNAARTSSFAAALRKLAKQAVDPVTEKELSPITPVSSPALSQRSTTPKRSIPPGMYLNSGHPHAHLAHQGSLNRIPSPPQPTNHSVENQKPLDLGPMSSLQTNASREQGNNNRLNEPLSLKLDSNKNERRHPSRSDEHLAPSSGRGFQPYRGLEEPRHSLGTSHGQHSSGHPPPHHVQPHFDVSTAASTAYPYHPAFLPQHLAHPAYRFDDPVYLDHYSSMLRPPSLMHPLTPAGLLPHAPSSTPSVPFFSSGGPGPSYPRDLIVSQPQNAVGFVSPGNTVVANHDSRMKIDERLSTRDSYSSEQEAQYDRRYHLATGSGRGSADPTPTDGDEQRDSPLPPLHLPRQLEAPGDRRTAGSIMQGTPRDHHLSSGLGPSQSPESPPTNISTAPLNLALHHTSNQELQRSRHQDVEMWVACQANAANMAPPTHHDRQQSEQYGGAGSLPPPPVSQHNVHPDHHQAPQYQHSPYHLHQQSNGMNSHHREMQEEANKQYQHHLQMARHHQQHQQAQAQQQQRKSYTAMNNNNPSHNNSHENNRRLNHESWKEKYSSANPPAYSEAPTPNPTSAPPPALPPPQASHPSHMVNAVFNGAMTKSSEERYHRGIPSLMPVVKEHEANVHLSMSQHQDNRNPQPPKLQMEKTAVGMLERWPYLHQDGANNNNNNLRQSETMEKIQPSAKVVMQPTCNNTIPTNQAINTMPSINQHCNNERSPSLVSKLDLEESRLRKARQSKGYNSENEGSEAAEDDNVEQTEYPEGKTKNWGPNGLGRPFLLVKGPPLTLETDAKKMELLRTVGLTTNRKRKEMELEKFLRRYNQLKEKPTLKIVNVENQENYRPLLVPPLFINALAIKPKKHVLNGEEGKAKKQQQNDFLAALGLEVNAENKRDEQERLWRTVLEERCHRHRIPLHLLELTEENVDTSDHVLSVRNRKRKLSSSGEDASPTYNLNGTDLREGTKHLENNKINKNTELGHSIENDSNKGSFSRQHRPPYLNPGGPHFLEHSGSQPSAPPPLLQLKPSSNKRDPEKHQRGYLSAPSSKMTLNPNLATTALSNNNTQTLLLNNNNNSVKPSLQHSSLRQMPREFAQEFHQLVLQTTKQKLDTGSSRDLVSSQSSSSAPCPPPPLLSSSYSSVNPPSLQPIPSLTGSSGGGAGVAASGFNNSVPLYNHKKQNSLLQYSSSNHVSASSSLVEKSSSRVIHEKDVDNSYYERDADGCLKWPGIEVIMESYEKHRREQNFEKDFLEERCQVLNSRSHELDRAVESYSQRMSELLQLKKHLDEERLSHQSSIDSLKKCLRQVR